MGNRVAVIGRRLGADNRRRPRAIDLNGGRFGAFIFVLAVFIGFELISKVPSTLHTPLMSGTNAIHGIVLVGALAVAVGRGILFDGDLELLG